MTEYAAKGLLGLITPQANTTAELEVQVLCPPGFAALTARLTSDKGTMEERLIDYIARMDDTIARFANAPIGAVAFACTGASYLIEPAEERRSLDVIEKRRGLPVVTAANAINDALGALDAKRVAIVSPYGDAIHDAAIRFWQGRGLEIVAVERLAGAEATFHPIYSLGGNATKAALETLENPDVDAFLVLGTGLATLGTVLDRTDKTTPLITANLALVWRSLLAITNEKPTRASLMPWLDGSQWAARCRERMQGAI